MYCNAVTYTSVFNAVILANSQAIMLLLGNLFTRARVTRQEGCGAMIAFLGAMLSSIDSSEASEDTESSMNNWLGPWGDSLRVLADVATDRSSSSLRK